MKLKSSLSALLSLSAIILLALPTIMSSEDSAYIAVRNRLNIPIELLWSTKTGLWAPFSLPPIDYPADPKNPKIIKAGGVFEERNFGAFGVVHYNIKITVPTAQGKTVVLDYPQQTSYTKIVIDYAQGPADEIKTSTGFERIVDVPGYGFVAVSVAFKNI